MACPAPVVIALACFVLRPMHLVLLWLIAEGDRVLRRTIGLFTIGKVAATALLLLALGLKKVLEYVGDAEHHRLSQPLHGVGLFALFFGVVLYLLGHVGFKRRTIHRWSVTRLTAAGLLVVAVPLVHGLPALAQLTALAVVLAGLVGFESFRFAGEREDLRHSEDPAAGPAETR